MKLGMVELPDNTYVGGGLSHVERVLPKDASAKIVRIEGLDGQFVAVTAKVPDHVKDKPQTIFVPLHQCSFHLAEGSKITVVNDANGVPVLRVVQPEDKPVEVKPEPVKVAAQPKGK